MLNSLINLHHTAIFREEEVVQEMKRKKAKQKGTKDQRHVCCSPYSTLTARHHVTDCLLKRYKFDAWIQFFSYTAYLLHSTCMMRKARQMSKAEKAFA